MKQKTNFLTLLLMMTFFLSGCVHTYTIPLKDATLPQNPLIEKLPIPVGVYYDDAFRSREYLKLPGTIFILGPPSVKLFDQIFPQMFERVIQVNNLPPFPQDEVDIKAVIQPKVVSLDINTGLEASESEAYLIYKITLYSLNGVEIANWSVEGTGYAESFDPTRDAVKNAMRDVAAQFMVGFRKNPEAVKWFKSIGIAAIY
jgi:hypothetical protein